VGGDLLPARPGEGPGGCGEGGRVLIQGDGTRGPRAHKAARSAPRRSGRGQRRADSMAPARRATPAGPRAAQILHVEVFDHDTVNVSSLATFAIWKGIADSIGSKEFMVGPGGEHGCWVGWAGRGALPVCCWEAAGPGEGGGGASAGHGPRVVRVLTPPRHHRCRPHPPPPPPPAAGPLRGQARAADCRGWRGGGDVVPPRPRRLDQPLGHGAARFDPRLTGRPRGARRAAVLRACIW
jgi:hypothetical protein